MELPVGVLSFSSLKGFSLCVFGFFFSSSMCSEINSPFYSLADLRSANLAMKNQSRQSRQGANNLIHLYQRNNKNILLLK